VAKEASARCGYYAIEALGLVEQLHHKVFSAIHSERKRLNTVEQVRVFAATHGADPNQFIQTMESFSVMTRVKQANALVKGYAIEGTPSIGVNGRWLTSGSMAGSHSRSLDVAEYLIGLARKG
jgi:thiol:disulfide interchange protein DsbA